MEEEKREHKMKMKKMEKEMESVFDTKVKEKRNRLKESQKDLERKHENVRFIIFENFFKILFFKNFVKIHFQPTSNLKFSKNYAMSKIWPNWSSVGVSLKPKKPSGRRALKMIRSVF